LQTLIAPALMASLVVRLAGVRVGLRGPRRQVREPRSGKKAEQMISLQNFRDAYGAQDFAARMSELIWRDMYELHTKGGVHPDAFLSAIKDVELGIATSGTKPAAPFKREPLAGLWHKHYFTPANLPGNLKRKKPRDELARAMFGTDGVAPTVATYAAIINRHAMEMAANEELTGEWIVFLRRAATNYYLCCGKHTDDQQGLLDRVINECTHDFPSLPAWVQEAAARATPRDPRALTPQAR
jgi:hypothetical protein